MEVTVLHLAEWLMEMQLDRKAGGMLKADLRTSRYEYRVTSEL